ncbi:hypothetical protein ACFV9C_16165 [Kribbella sp. NPDC059898]|uniref:hypothetical protein n=1 Tax=Kribbella sp. NPDC059898 TaxID=3346995 RepID=UPI00365CD8FD
MTIVDQILVRRARAGLTVGGSPIGRIRADHLRQQFTNVLDRILRFAAHHSAQRPTLPG